jgi:hypothetical protein
MQILKTASLTDARVATVAAGAFFDVTTDLGLPGDIAGKYFVLVDSTGKKASGFVLTPGTNYYQSTGWRVAFVSGSAYDGANAGFFDLAAGSLSSNLSRIISARLIYRE